MFFFQSQAEVRFFFFFVTCKAMLGDSGSEGSGITGTFQALRLCLSFSLRETAGELRGSILSHQRRGVVMDRIRFWPELRTRMQFMV